MWNYKFFLDRCLESIKMQTFKDYEIIMTNKGNASENTNSGIKQAKGDYIKFMHQDDYFSSPNSLQKIVDEMPFDWLVSGCVHDNGQLFREHYPVYDERTDTGVNTIGSPSVLTIKNDSPFLFDERLVWVLDIEYYRRLFDRYGLPTILNEVNVVIGIHKGQASNNIKDKIKLEEDKFIQNV